MTVVDQATPNSGGRTWKRPSEALVSEAIHKIGDLQHRRVFFTELKNPEWVKPLRCRGFFQAAPPVRTEPAGIVTVPVWPESQYLARMAASAPSAVAAAFSEMDDAGNPSVRGDVIAAASQMPPAVAKLLVPKIVAFLDEGLHGYFDLDALGGLLTNLLEAKETRSAARLAQALFAPRAAREKTSTLPVAVAGLGQPWYEETLTQTTSALVDGLGANALRALVHWLENWQVITGHAPRDGSFDHSSMWRPSIAPHAHNHGSTIGDALVVATRETAWLLARRKATMDEVLRILAQSRQPLLRRIAFDLLVRLLEAEDDWAVAAAQKDVLEPHNLDVNLRHEYAALVNATLQRTDEAAIRQWEDMVREWPHELHDDLRTTMAAVRQVDRSEVTEAEIDHLRRVRQHDLLAATRDVLTPDGSAWLATLEAELGAVAETDFPFATRVFMGPQSPMSAVELGAKGAEELIAYLRSWSPDLAVFFGPSREGLGRALTQVVQDNPSLLGERAPEVAAINPTYARAVLLGWEQALRERRPIPWQSAMDVIERAVNHPDEGDVQPSALRQQDPGWRWSHREAAALLEAGLAPDRAISPPTSLRERVWAAIARLAESPDPTVTRGAQSDMSREAMSESLNTVRGRAMRAAVAYLAWLEAQGLAEPGNAQTQAPEVLALLDEHLDPTKDASAGVRVIYGEQFPYLFASAPEWSRNRVARIFGGTRSWGTTRALGDVAWDMLTATHWPNRELFSALRQQYRNRLARLAASPPSDEHYEYEAPAIRLAGSALLLYVQGVVEIDSADGLIALLFSSEDAALRRAALSHLGWLAFRSEGGLPAEVIERLQRLWEWRETQAENDRELAAFSWWFLSKALPEDWAVTHLCKAVELTDDIEMPYQVTERLAALAERYPKESLAIIDALTKEDSGGWSRSALVDHAPPIVAAALRSQDVDLHEGARRLMDKLGRAGHIGFKRRVDSLLDSYSDA